jgi:dihydroorotase
MHAFREHRVVCLALALLAGAPLLPAQADLVLQGGRVIDPMNGLDAIRDVAITGGRISAVGEGLQGRRTIDVKGMVVTPGLVDIHAHFFHTTGVAEAWAGDNSIRPDDFSFRTGVTTMVDAGSSGWRNFETFRHTVLDRAKTRVYALINIAGLGMLTNMAEQHPEDMKPREVARLAKKHRDLVVGVKTAHYEGPEWVAVDRAIEAGKLAGLPVMVDFGYFLPQRPWYQLVEQRLRPGDIVTHAYRAPAPWADENGKLYPYLHRARARGVKFDVGHGGGSFAWRNAAPAVAQGFWPDSISTDLHTGSMNGAMMDMPTTMSKFLSLGMPLRAVVERSTVTPALLIGKPELGHLSVGAEADVAVFRLMQGDFAFADSDRGLHRGRTRLFCELTLRAGEVVWDWAARIGTDYRNLPKDYGVRPAESITPPPK